jgi:hypothetical protein
VGWVGEEYSLEAAVFVILVCVWVYSVVGKGVCVRDCRVLGLCKVHTAGWFVGN